MRRFLVLVLAAGCASDPTTQACIPGASGLCACPSGRTGAQRCLDDGTFDLCVCDVDGGVGDVAPTDALPADAGGSEAAPDAAPDIEPLPDAGADLTPPTCEQGWHPCGLTCARNANLATCGDRCTTCPEPAHSTATCDSVVCGFTCAQGYHASEGQCVLVGHEICGGVDKDVQTDTANCGQCSHVCPVPVVTGYEQSQATCTAGVCGGVCTWVRGTWTVCNNTCTEIATDRENCGYCGHVCPYLAYGYHCVDGQCTPP
jgi:hypothetical protein